MPVTHAFTSAKADPADATKVGKSKWNAGHQGMADGFFNVKDTVYGALGNGSNDDTAEIQAAIDACATAGGGIVYFPPGSYIVSGATALTYPGDQVVLRGAGSGQSVNNAQNPVATTRIKYNGTGSVLSNSSGSLTRYWCGIEDMTLDMRDASSGFTAGLNLNGFNHFIARNVVIDSTFQSGAPDPANYRDGVGILLTGSDTKSTYYNEFHNIDIAVGTTCVVLRDLCNANYFWGGNWTGDQGLLIAPISGTSWTTDTCMFFGVSIQCAGSNAITLGSGTAGQYQVNQHMFFACRVECYPSGYPSTRATIVLNPSAHWNAFVGGTYNTIWNDGAGSGGGNFITNIQWDWLNGGGSAGFFDIFGSGTPEGNMPAAPGSLYRRTDGGAGTSLYIKETGTGTTGWKRLVGA